MTEESAPMTGPMALSDAELGELEKLAKAAPECPIKSLMDWSSIVDNGGTEFYKAARKAFPVLVTMARRTAEIEKERDAVITLLYSDQVFVQADWEDFSKKESGVWPTLCAHAANYGADAEKIPQTWWIPLARAINKHGFAAIEAWVCYVRKIEKPVKGSLSPEGLAALAAFKAGSQFEGLSQKYLSRLRDAEQRASAAEAHAARLRERVSRLREALGPFAVKVHPKVPDDTWTSCDTYPIDGSSRHQALWIDGHPVSIFRRATAVLAETAPDTPAPTRITNEQIARDDAGKK